MFDLLLSTPDGVIGFIVVLLGALGIFGKLSRTQFHFHVFSTDPAVRVAIKSLFLASVMLVALRKYDSDTLHHSFSSRSRSSSADAKNGLLNSWVVVVVLHSCASKKGRCQEWPHKGRTCEL